MVIQRPEDDTGPEFKSRALRDSADLNAEVAGQQTGRQARFLVGNNSIRVADDRKKREETQQFYSLLEMLLRDDPHYARLYRGVSEKIEKAWQAVDLALIDIKQRHEAAVRELQRLRDNAGMLPDGTRVFRSSIDNGIYTENGQRLNDADAQRASIPNGAPSWEEYHTAREEQHRLEKDREETVRYREEVLRPAQVRLRNKDDPPSLEELQDIDRRIDERMPVAVARHTEGVTANLVSRSSHSAAHEMVGATELSVPDLRDHFDAVRAPQAMGQITATPQAVRTAAPV